MGYFAEVIEGVVTRVIVADKEFINSGKVGDPKNWKETFKSTEKKVRFNPAAIGCQYDKDKDAFIPKKPFNSWTLDEKTMNWKAPKEKLAGDKEWNEEKGEWEEWH